MLIKDQIGENVDIQGIPKRIISLVPSITYTLSDFGLEQEIIGITRFCKYPTDWKNNKRIIGGTKQLKIEQIKQLAPELILASKEENTKEEIENLSQYFPVYVSDVKDYKSNINFIKDLGLLLSKENKAKDIIKTINKKYELISNLSGTKKKGLYLIWKNPWMSVGGDTFIHTMLNEAGFDNLLEKEIRYPQISLEKIKKLKPEYLLLSSEPYPFKEKHRLELAKELPDTKIVLVNGEYFSWFGTYPIKAYDYFTHLKTYL